MKKSERLTIGFFVDTVISVGNYQTDIWAGICDAASKYNINLACFLGSNLKYSPQNEFTEQKNYVYDLFNPEVLSGLIIMGSIGSYIGLNELKNFHKKYNAVPTISIGTPIKGVPSVIVDNYQGMQNNISHLIKEHNCKNIAFIKGPKEVPEVNERFQAYLDTLKKNQISFDPDFIFQGDFMPESGKRAARYFLDLKNKKIDAIVAVNDNMALGAISELIQMGIDVPGEISVTGFDDIEEAKASIPSLTTVKQPIFKLGELAVEYILKKIKGEEIPLKIVPKTELMVRQSCKCFDIRKQEFKYQDKLKNRKILIDLHNINPKELLEILTHEIGAIEGDIKKTRKLCKEIIDVFLMELKGHKEKIFIEALYNILSSFSKRGKKVAIWQKLVDVFYAFFIGSIDDCVINNRLFRLCHSASLLISDMDQRLAILKKDQLEKESVILYNVSSRLIASFNILNLVKMLKKELPSLGIKNCYLFVYNKYLKDPAIKDNYVLKEILQFNDNNLNTKKQKFIKENILKELFLKQNDRKSLVLFSLCFKNEHFGFIVFDSNPQKNVVHETLVRQISTTIEGAVLFEDQAKSKKSLEKTLMEIAELNKKLEVLSISDEMTGLYNRRGFLTLATQQYKLAIREKKKVLLFFADLDGLKEINDTYGHQEGDKAILCFSQALKKSFRKSDIIGRLGGDEFTILAFDAGLDNFFTIKNKIYTELNYFNEKKTNKFILSASIGVTCYDPEEDLQGNIDFMDLMHQADSSLYKNKKERKQEN